MSDISNLRDKVQLRDALAERINDLTKQLEALDTLIQDHVGDDEEALIDGQPAFTWARTAKIRTKDLAKAHPDLYSRFLVDKVSSVLDTDTLRTVYPDLVKEFSSRSWRRVQ
jgi:hypothetical protein